MEPGLMYLKVREQLKIMALMLSMQMLTTHQQQELVLGTMLEISLARIPSFIFMIQMEVVLMKKTLQ